MLPHAPPKNYKISSAFSYNFKLALTSSGALQYANNLLGTKVVLVDGLTLTRLMIKHNVGVSVEHIYEVKKVDSDFFSEEL